MSLKSLISSFDKMKVKEAIVITGINDEASKCKNKSCNKKCGLLHIGEIKECIKYYNLTKDIANTIYHSKKLKIYALATDVLINKNEKNFNGAGVLLISGEHIILFKSTNLLLKGYNVGNYYCAIGCGRIDKDETLQMTASRELYEESCKTFLVSKDTFDRKADVFFDIKNNRDDYYFRCFIIEIPNIISTIKDNYINNQKEIDKSDIKNMPYCETDQIAIIKISNIMNKIKEYTYECLKPEVCKDIDSNNRIINLKSLQVIYRYANELKEPIKIDKIDITSENNINTIVF